MIDEHINAPQRPDSLVENLAEGRCVLFAGAGLSAWAKLLNWEGVLNFVVNKLYAEKGRNNESELESLLRKGKFLEVADHCKEQLGEGRYNEIIASQLRGDVDVIPEPHKLIVFMPFAAAITTNYDILLEKAYVIERGFWPKAPTHKNVEMLGTLLLKDDFYILKAHGNIDEPDTLIFTSSDYRKLIHSNQAFNALFTAILLTKAILFLGYSLSDPDFRLLLERQFTIFNGNVPPRYALMTGVGKVERDFLWRTARINVLHYREHNDILEFLEALKNDVVLYRFKKRSTGL